MTSPPSTGSRWPLAVVVGSCVLAVVQMRGAIPGYVEWYLWLREQGVPKPICGLDAPLLLLLGAWLGARLATGRGRVSSVLGLAGSWREGLAFGLLAGTPMLLQGWIGRSDVDLSSSTARAIVAMPFAEEVFFRGLLVFIPVAVGGCRFWTTAILAGLLFGSLHVPWDPSMLSWGDFAEFAVATAGGIWYAWIGRCFRWSLWPTIVLHGAMNAAWVIFGIDDTAAGGLWPNVGRGLTIAAGTVLALRHTKRTLRGEGGRGSLS
ncbi:MAG TPA: CPBP family intramembrane glutamic endopeptidase [Planctomycetota bacterium]